MDGGQTIPFIEDRGLEADATEQLREMNRVTAIFQLRAIAAVIGIPMSALADEPVLHGGHNGR